MFTASPKKRYLAVALAALAAVSMWSYVRKILIPYQVQDAAQVGRPRGVLSDLYPRWFGARELLLHGRNPYSQEVTREIQRGYYGRSLDPPHPGDPKDQAGFAYPVYAVFLLAPFVHAQFSVVQAWGEWILGLLALTSLLMWQRVVGSRFPIVGSLAAMLFLLASYPFVEAASLQQPVLLVMALLAGSFLARNRGRLFLSGVLMAVATIKPQTVVFPVILMLMWVSWNWRERRRWFYGFAATMLVLLAASEYLLTGWLFQFYGALRAYQTYMAGNSLLDMFMTPHWAWLGRTVIVIGILWVNWKSRGALESSVESRRALSLTLAGAVLSAPNLGTYNQILLVPAMLLIVEQWNTILRGSRFVRGIASLMLTILAWPWVASGALALAVLVFHASWPTQAELLLPLYGTLPLPLATAAVLLALPAKRSGDRSLAAVPRGVSCTFVC